MSTVGAAGPRTVTTDDGVELYVRVEVAHAGPGAPVLLAINSLGCDLGLWEQQLAPWRQSHHVLRYDQRGHGRSAAPDGPYGLDRLGRDALAVLDAVGADRVDVCGLSLGGLVAQWLCLEAPGRIDRAVFADTAARIGTREAWHERAAVVRTEGMAAVTEPVLDRFFSQGARATNDPAVVRTRAGLETMSPEGYASSCEALADADLRPRTAAIGQRCLVIVGTEDVATPVADARRLVDDLPHASYAELDGAGHLSNLERPEAFARLVRTFLGADRGA